MKKVRYALGAVGFAPAVGLMLPAPAAAAAAAHTPTGGKTVSLQHQLRGPATPAISCGASHITPSDRSPHGLRIGVVYSLGGGGCIAVVTGDIKQNKPGLDMRIRIYAHPGGTRVFQNYVSGSAFLGTTSFNSSPNVHGQQVCIALVESNHHSIIVNNWGPVCQTI